MPTIVVSGAANGLGAAFIEAYRSQPGVQLVGIDRVSFHTSQHTIQSRVVDITSEPSITEFVDTIKDTPIDMLIHSAGVRGLVPAAEETHPRDVAACETMPIIDGETLHRAFQVNAVGTFMLVRALLPNLQLARDAKVVIMSSRMGSLGNNEIPNKDAGSAYAYRASKAAMNTIVRSFAVDVPDVTFVLCHPGRVETKLVRCKEEGAISAEESVTALLPLIERWDKRDTGKFFDRFGESIPW